MLPVAGANQRRRPRVRRPLTVSTVCSARPFLSRRWPLAASVGGKSRFRGIDPELHGGLVDRLAEVGAEVADRFLTAVKDLSSRGLVNSVRHAAAEFLEPAAQGIAPCFRA